MERSQATEQEPVPTYQARHTETSEILDLDDLRFESIEGILRPGLYRHYKSTPSNLKFYVVEKAVRDTEDEESYAIYRSLDANLDTMRSARPLRMFTEMVLDDQGRQPRFRYMGQLY